jgi:hypothetical protein
MEVDTLVRQLLDQTKGLRLFFDRLVLQEGQAWQEHIGEALDNCRHVITVFSPNFLGSKRCKFEFNVAMARQTDTETEILFPVYLESAPLPTYMCMYQWADCRERDMAKLSNVGSTIVSKLRS